MVKLRTAHEAVSTPGMMRSCDQQQGRQWSSCAPHVAVMSTRVHLYVQKCVEFSSVDSRKTGIHCRATSAEYTNTFAKSSPCGINIRVLLRRLRNRATFPWEKWKITIQRHLKLTHGRVSTVEPRKTLNTEILLFLVLLRRHQDAEPGSRHARSTFT